MVETLLKIIVDDLGDKWSYNADDYEVGDTVNLDMDDSMPSASGREVSWIATYMVVRDEDRNEKYWEFDSEGWDN